MNKIMSFCIPKRVSDMFFSGTTLCQPWYKEMGSPEHSQLLRLFILNIIIRIGSDQRFDRWKTEPQPPTVRFTEERAAAAGRRRRRGVNPLRPCLFFASWIAGGGGYCTSLGRPPVPASLVAWCVGPLLVVHRRRTCDEPTVRLFTSCGLYFSGSLLSDDLTYTASESLDGWRSVILSKFQSSSSFQTAIVLSSFFSGGC
jgi:hypothetical protein